MTMSGTNSKITSFTNCHLSTLPLNSGQALKATIKDYCPLEHLCVIVAHRKRFDSEFLKWLTVYCFLLFPMLTFSQSDKIAVNEISAPTKAPQFLKEKIYYGNDEAVVREKLEERFHCELQIKNKTGTSVSDHFTFTQLIKDIPVYGKFIKVNLDKNGFSLSLIYELSFSETKNKHLKQENKTWMEMNGELIPAYKKIKCEDQFCSEIIHNENEEIIFQKPLSISKNRSVTDTTISVKVFIPDPLTSANVNYGTPYSDQNNADVTELNAQLYPAATIGGISNDTFYLENSFVKITDHSLPTVTPPWSLLDQFLFNRGHANFEETNILYHITEMQLWIQSLGFTNLVSYKIHADAHGLNGADNSNFNPAASPPRLTFGDGGVDDGEDADVIIHEYCHAVSYSAAPGTTIGNERLAIEEGNSDYFAASYSKNIDPYNWQNVYSWDGHNEFWAGRFVQSIKTYPADISGNFYQDAEIWSSTLMQIWDDLGRFTTDQLLLQSMYSYTSNMTMPQAAALILEADTLLNSGANYSIICTHFASRGILNCPLSVTEPNGNLPVVINTNGLEIQFQKETTYGVEIFDVTGKLIASENGYSGSFIYQSETAGIFLAKIKYGETILSVKFIQS